jgi:alkanesulfonate monooxygenase SsuD/methylene tetrahydromethanopterin reductase-like flavin-dependent oxidoreductase (luciferase family)
LVAHLPVCVHDDPNGARDAVRQLFAGFARAPFYQNMFIAAGFPEVSQGTWSDAMVDSVAAWGDESRVMESLQQLFSLGASEIMASPVPAGVDREASLDRTLRLLSQAATSIRG